MFFSIAFFPVSLSVGVSIMSFVLLASSLLYEFSGFGWFDALGTIGIIWFSIKEGKEAFEKAKGNNCACHC